MNKSFLLLFFKKEESFCSLLFLTAHAPPPEPSLRLGGHQRDCRALAPFGETLTNGPDSWKSQQLGPLV
jgi:hypothetical protein